MSEEPVRAEMLGYRGPFQVAWIAEWQRRSPAEVLDIAMDMERAGRLRFVGASPCKCARDSDWDDCVCGREVFEAVVERDRFTDGGGI